MILVGNVPFSTNSSPSSSSQGTDILVALMEHPLLASASESFKAIPEKKVSVYEDSTSGGMQQSKFVYVFQREYATVSPALADFVGTDEATTCIGLVIRNRDSGMTSVAHMDSPEIVDVGLTQMLSLVVDKNFDAELDVHLIGAFEDISTNVWLETLLIVFGEHDVSSSKLASGEEPVDYSFRLATKIVETLKKRREKFHIHTLFVLKHNTRRDSEGNPYPIFHGLLVETATGSLVPACFDRTSRCPDEIVRRIRVSAAYEDPTWNGRLLETYDTQTDCFRIAPCYWSQRQVHFALALQNRDDTEILLTCSTSPSAEGPDFVENLRRQWDYVTKNPYWRETFPMKQPRLFRRQAKGDWIMCS